MSDKFTLLGNPHNLPKGAVLVPNRIDLACLQFLHQALKGHKVIFLVEENAPVDAQIRNYFESSHAAGRSFAVSSEEQARLAGEALLQDAGENCVFVFVPRTVKAHQAALWEVTAEVGNFLANLKLALVPVYVSKDLGGTLLGHTTQRSISLLEQVHSWPQVQAQWYAASHSFFNQQSFLQSNLLEQVVGGILRNPNARVIDGTDDSSVTFLKLLAAATAFAKHLNLITKNRRIGVILPAGKACIFANLACLLAGKVPVNINFTASKSSFEASVKQAKLDRFITADTFMRKMADFSWPPNRDLIKLEDVRSEYEKSIKYYYVAWRVFSKLGSVKWALKLLGLDNMQSPQDECALLFTSGSSNEPKGVVLSNSNILANIAQCAAALELHSGDRLLGCLPMFHSFGFTVTLWFPLIEGLDIVTYPSPLEVKRIGELIKNYQLSLVMLTPTFLRGFIKRCSPDTFSSVKMVVTGAEKLNAALAEAFQARFGLMPMEGYGLTETSPVVAFSQAELASSQYPVIPSYRQGSVGKLLPGIDVKITSPFDDAPQQLDELGVLWFRGANVFGGYLNLPEVNAEVLHNGWLKTGDIGRIDESGFLYIEGRVSRFSKIGGEMVPHEQLEAAIMQALNIDPADPERKIAVVGVADEQKGEAIALLSVVATDTPQQEQMVLRYRLMDLKIPPLWCPKYVLRCEAIPILPTGKLDIKSCQLMARKLLNIE